MEPLNKQELDLIGHSLGVNIYHARLSKKKKDKKLPKEYYRNYFSAGNEQNDNYLALVRLKERGLMSSSVHMEQTYFYVTDAGKEAFKAAFEAAMLNNNTNKGE